MRTRHEPSFPPASARLAAVLSLALVVAVGCSRRKLPSDDFARANEIHSRLFAQKLDDAYLDPHMDEAEALLKRVPADSLDADSAQQLLERIQKNRARVKGEHEAREKAVAAASAPPQDAFSNRPREIPAPGPAGEVPDAGPTQPAAGMSLDEFTHRFSGCFQPGQQMLVPDRGLRDSWELKDITLCRDRHPGFDQLIVVIEGDKIWGFGKKDSVQKEQQDGGAPPGGNDGGTPPGPSGG